jgi:Activator of Hsp90 ATPase homolog 1-like protein
MPAKTDEIHAGISSAAVRAKTGKGWPQWFAVLDKAGATKWPHKEIAIYLHDKCDCGNWWCQMVTVGYEQARGLRVKHQVADGFSANGSKTVAVPIAKLFAAWSNAKTRAKWLPDSARITIRRATKNRSMRITWSDGESSVEVMFYPKGANKSQVTIERRKLPNAKSVAGVKAYWKAALNKLKALLEE